HTNGPQTGPQTDRLFQYNWFRRMRLIICTVILLTCPLYLSRMSASLIPAARSFTMLSHLLRNSELGVWYFSRRRTVSMVVLLTLPSYRAKISSVLIPSLMSSAILE